MRVKQLISLLVLVLAVLLIITVCYGAGISALSSPTQATDTGVIELIYSTPHEESEPPAVYGDYFCTLVEDMSNGRVRFESYYGGMLGTALEHGKLLGRGAIDIATVSFDSERTPLHQYMNWNLGSGEAALDVQTQLYQEIPETSALLKEELESLNVKFLYSASSGPNGIIATFEFDSLEDLKGRKVGIIYPMPSLENLGMNTVLMDLPDMYGALSRGVIDAISMASSPMVALGWYEISTCFMDDNGYSPGRAMMINLDVWEGLPSDIQAIFLEAAARTQEYGTGQNAIEAEQIQQVFRNYGLKVGTLSDADCETLFRLQYEGINARMLELCAQQGKTDEAMIILDHLDELVWGQ
jgi:TRAP-type C4-dicarboxylate transport system substrate-binding protein